MVIICLFCCCRELNLHNSTFMVNLVLFSRNFVLNWKTDFAFLSQLSWNSNNDIALPSYIIIFKINVLQNNRNLFYLLNLAGIDHKTTMGRIAAASPTAEEQNKQSPSKPKITLHSPKHDINSSFRSAGIQVQDQFVHGNLKKRVWGSQYCETLWLFLWLLFNCWSSFYG